MRVVKVTFPGGLVKDVPSRKIPESDRRGLTFKEQPIYDPKWSFVAVEDGWIAVRR